ncbi:hypothetical protein AB0I81_05890 [Nonomuraea sp. NPDC050404]|uniref:hypothetical protein n=1 Tax=Nonomuraea sp. NPDC050404 TaxID=3155783 RepID=UPI0034051830
MIADSSCGGCSAIAAELAGILAVPVLVRSCRDPHLPVEFPVVRGERPCARPLAVEEDEKGSARLLGGVPLWWRGARLVAPGRRAAALRLAWTLAGLRLRHLLGTSPAIRR